MRLVSVSCNDVASTIAVSPRHGMVGTERNFTTSGRVTNGCALYGYYMDNILIIMHILCILCTLYANFAYIMWILTSLGHHWGHPWDAPGASHFGQAPRKVTIRGRTSRQERISDKSSTRSSVDPILDRFNITKPWPFSSWLAC